MEEPMWFRAPLRMKLRSVSPWQHWVAHVGAAPCSSAGRAWSSHSSHEAAPKDATSSTKTSQEIYGKYTMLWWKHGRDQADLSTPCSQAGQQEDSRALGELHIPWDTPSAQSS